MINYFFLQLKLQSSFSFLKITVLLILILIILSSCKRSYDESEVVNLEKLKNAYTWNMYTDKGRSYLSELKSEAEQLSNERYLGVAYYYLARECRQRRAYDFNDSSYIYLDKAKEHYTKANYFIGQVLVEIRRSEFLTLDKKFDQALDVILPLLKDPEVTDDTYLVGSVYSALSHTYWASGDYEESLKAMDVALDAFFKINSSGDYSENISYLLMQKAVVMNKLEKYDLSLAYIILYNANLNNDIASPQLIENKSVLSKAVLVDNLLEMGDINRTDSIIEWFQTNYKPDSQWLLAIGFDAILAKYNYKIGNYALALDYLNSPKTMLIYDINREDIEALKLRILTAMGDYEAALKVKKGIVAYKDSVRNSDTHKRIAYIKNNLQNSIQEQQLTYKSWKERTLIIALAVFCVFLLVILYIRGRSVRLLKKKNGMIFTQLQNLDRYTNKEKSELLSGDYLNKLSEPTLFEKIELYLYSSESFLEPDLTRESLALELGTNREYLTKAIQEGKGMTFLEYINEFRLEYARRLLSYNVDLPVEEIYLKSGFNSKSTFYRLFKQKYDLTPIELREIALAGK